MQDASGYIRLSREAGAANTSLAGMEADLRTLAERLGVRLVALHADNGISGAVRDRPEFTAWLDDARTGRVDVLLAYHADRLTREGVNAAALVLDVVEGKDPTTGRVVRPPVRLVSWDGLDSERDAESFRWRFVIAAEVARAERERIRARTSASNARLARAGRWSGGEVPFGFQSVENPDGPGKVLDLEPDEAEALRWAASQVLAGVPLGRVARRLSERGVAPRRAASWSRVTLRQSLTGEHVLGRVTYRGEVLRDDDGRPFAPWPAILDPDTVAALRQALASSPRKRPGRHPARLLSGLVTCHSCGSRLAVARRSDGSVTYRCQRSSEGGLCQAQVVAAALPLEAYVEGRFLKEFGRLPTFERRVIVDGASALADVEDRIAALTASLARSATPATFASLQTAQAERDALEAAPRATSETLVPTGRTMAEEWQAGDTDHRRALLADAYPSLVLFPGRRGPRGFDPDRLVVHVTPGEDSSFYAD